MPNTALIVDDEPDILELLDITLSQMGIEAQKAETIGAARQLLQSQEFDLCLTDMHLPDGNGIDLVAHIRENHQRLPVAVITAFGSIETAITALKAGAFDFVSKPVDLKQLRGMIQQALKISTTDAAAGDAQAKRSGLLGESKSIHKLHSQIKKVALSQAPIYISGESGSGKEVAARMIHALGARSDHAFVPVNCGAIPGELMESEFFGHKKGSFTGAIADKEGLFQSADGGTLFLDEVADLPMHMQVKLLRAIQEKAIRPIGAQQEIPIDVRILSATHKNLATEVDAGNFRQDMFYRINVIELKIPSLRERREDIPLLSDHFLQRLAEGADLPAATLSSDALWALETYSFPGNVRELENILERAYTLCEDNRIEEGDLQLSSAATATSDTETCQPILNEVLPGEGLPSDSLDDYLEEIEKQAILKALEETRWNRTAAAEKLGISFRQMRHRLKKFGID